MRGHGYIAIAQKHQLPVPTVQSVIARAERAGGNPVARSQEEEAEQRRARESCAVVLTETLSPAIEGSSGQQNRSEHCKSLSCSCETAVHGEGCPGPGA